MSETRDQEFIEYVVKSLVDHPESVVVERKIDEMGVLITLSVHADDMGMVIGREGMTAKALRTLLRVIGAKNNARVNLKINEPEGSTRGERREAPVAAPVVDEMSAMTESAAPAEEPKQRTLDDVMSDIRI
jgi:predicted RNA-binding protein YlqC (UPF0109 family)